MFKKKKPLSSVRNQSSMLSRSLAIKHWRLPDSLLVTVQPFQSGQPIPLKPLNFPLPNPLFLDPDFSGPAVSPGDRIWVKIVQPSKGPIIAKFCNTSAVEDIAIPFVGIIHQENQQYFLIPCHRKKSHPYLLKETESYQAGQIVLANLGPNDTISIHKNIGYQNDARCISLITLHAHQLPETFPDNVLKEAHIASQISLEGRKDLTDINFVTIDSPEAQDFDDAVWAEPQESGWHVIVAIADVAAYVRPGTALDEEAIRRGNSVYFPDRVVPMLPEVLSNGVCSLKPGQKRACLAVHLWIDSEGHLKNYQFVRGMMRSRAQLTYQQIQEQTDLPDHLPLELIPSLFGAYEALKKARQKREALDLSICEYKVILNPLGQIEGFCQNPRWPSNQLIEEFMIAANVAAASVLAEKKVPCLYRNHEPPPLDKIQELRETLKGLKISFPQGQVSSKKFNQTLRSSAKTPYAALVHQLILLSQSLACYGPKNHGHFGLNLPLYCHFTSPIRRYADLTVHRNLIQTLQLGDINHDVSINETNPLERLGYHLSERAKIATAAEREVMERYGILYYQNHCGKIFPGMITSIASFGCFVRLEETGVEGLIPISCLKDDFYIYEKPLHRLVGRHKGRIYHLGTNLKVRLINLNPYTCKLTFEPVVSPKTATKKNRAANASRNLRTYQKQERRHKIPLAKKSKPR